MSKKLFESSCLLSLWHNIPVKIVHVNGVRKCLWTAATNGPSVHLPDDGWVWRARWNDIDRGNRRTRRNPAPMSLYPPQIPHGLTSARTRASAMSGRRLTASATARSRPRERWTCVLIWADLQWANHRVSTWLIQSVRTFPSHPGYKVAGACSWPLTSTHAKA
jgi:hypothetical protein